MSSKITKLSIVFFAGAVVVASAVDDLFSDESETPAILLAALTATSLSCLESDDLIGGEVGLLSSESDVMTGGVWAGVWPGDGWWRGVVAAAKTGELAGSKVLEACRCLEYVIQRAYTISDSTLEITVSSADDSSPSLVPESLPDFFSLFTTRICTSIFSSVPSRCLASKPSGLRKVFAASGRPSRIPTRADAFLKLCSGMTVPSRINTPSCC
ncbi:hypothetical protein RRF57_007702 [Xylaria bambusicola]|uniref:Secreted protein n=1 Tax=Xylaria bambusicola TaxID=326684 RepID=A0AAN7ZAX9_9PEZI